MTLQERVEALLQLRTYLLESPSDLEVATRQAFLHNRWFSIENTTIAIESIARHFLSAQNLENWINESADKTMFAGVPGVGAEEGWYITQLLSEQFRFKE